MISKMQQAMSQYFYETVLSFIYSVSFEAVVVVVVVKMQNIF